MTKTAFTYWQDRIAPLFDTARQIRVVEIESGQIVSETEETLLDEQLFKKALRLAELGVEALVCGAISRPMQELVSAYGIKVVPFIAGELREVIAAWLSGEIEQEIYAMPGCCGRFRRRYREMGRPDKEERKMNFNGRGQGAGGGGQARRRGAGAGGQGGGQGKGGEAGICLCPGCGYSEPHKRGIPCSQNKCPKCGEFMRRQLQ